MGTKNETYHGVFSFWVEFCGVCICKRKANTCLILNRNGLGRCFFFSCRSSVGKAQLPFHSRTLRANSHTASCMPKQTPAHNKSSAYEKIRHKALSGLRTNRTVFVWIPSKNNFFLVSDGCR